MNGNGRDNMSEEEMKEVQDTLKRIESSTARTEQAVFGDEKIGLIGLVGEVKSLKEWRGATMLKASLIGGAVGGSIIGLKTLLVKWLGQ
jgi:hypothetical protein